MIQRDIVPPMGLLSQLGTMKPSFSLLIPFQDPKSYTELNTKTKLDWELKYFVESGPNLFSVHNTEMVKHGEIEQRAILG